MNRRITILGSTGSIGVSTLDVVARHPDRYAVEALTAYRDVDGLLRQCLQFRPRYAVMVDESGARQLKNLLSQHGLATEVLAGAAALTEIAGMPGSDTIMAAIVGVAGLPPTMAAARAGKTILLANKESLVSAGPVFVEAVRRSGSILLPIDSEHNAVFQALPAGYAGNPGDAGVRRILLTASGGPFRRHTAEQLRLVTPEAACAHPNWVMGRKISVDSATMMNKGLEVIEAHWLFNAAPEQIEVVVHPESVVHSLVEYVDGSVLAQLGNPDMRTPIAHALGYPERINAGTSFLDLVKTSTLHFEAPDFQRFPSLRLAYDALAAGGNAPIALNAANEVAVSRFLTGNLRFIDIPALVEDVMSATPAGQVSTLDGVLGVDAECRRRASVWQPFTGSALMSAQLPAGISIT